MYNCIDSREAAVELEQRDRYLAHEWVENGGSEESTASELWGKHVLLIVAPLHVQINVRDARMVHDLNHNLQGIKHMRFNDFNNTSTKYYIWSQSPEQKNSFSSHTGTRR